MITSFDDTGLYRFFVQKLSDIKHIEHNTTAFWKNQEVFQKNCMCIQNPFSNV